MSNLKNILEDVKLFLPKYLSDSQVKSLFENLKNFPNNIENKFYGSYHEKGIIFQGDILKGFTIANLKKKVFYENIPVVILSNTCDIDVNNVRMFDSSICYSPILTLQSYAQMLLREKLKDETSIQNHVENIKKQRITQIIYLPKGGKLPEDCIAFLDRINHIDSSEIDRGKLDESRLAVMSNYGFYIFLTKLSIHFTRIQEKIDRG